MRRDDRTPRLLIELTKEGRTATAHAEPVFAAAIRPAEVPTIETVLARLIGEMDGV